MDTEDAIHVGRCSALEVHKLARLRILSYPRAENVGKISDNQQKCMARTSLQIRDTTCIFPAFQESFNGTSAEGWLVSLRRFVSDNGSTFGDMGKALLEEHHAASVNMLEFGHFDCTTATSIPKL